MSQELETSAAQGLETGVYVISSIAFPGGSIGAEKSGPNASGITPRNVVSWPASPNPEVVQVKNLGGGRYNLISGGFGTSPKSKKVVGIVFPPTSGEAWALEYKAEYDGYTISSTSQTGAWTLPNGNKYTELDVTSIPSNAQPDVLKKSVFHFLRVYRPGHGHLDE